ncbi:hypothetical protein EG68_05691 [Paragonimus skrjabini miyazakii]|uniref:Uncharacterized protein n=1 Tax=Paragonimus skrjabini miyazakii TaxID=59628 RepID=A0A8S9YQE4_9TREM|nr:hypothetical protein EG68_05691 [Paragonimus skrjabini miyazakii]
MDESLVRELWLSKLSEATQPIVSDVRSQTLAETAKIGDQLVERFQPLLSCLSVSHSSPRFTVATRGPDNVVTAKRGPTDIEALGAEITTLRHDLKKIPANRSSDC